MKKSRFTDPQIVASLREGESGVPVAARLRKHGGATVAEFRRLKELGWHRTDDQDASMPAKITKSSDNASWRCNGG